jgi:hypothetical protein
MPMYRVRPPTPQELRADIAKRQQETAALSRHNKAQRQLKVVVCPACGYEYILKSRRGTVTSESACWPCMICGCGTTGEAMPEPVYKDPMSGVLRNQAELDAWLDNPTR